MEYYNFLECGSYCKFVLKLTQFFSSGVNYLIPPTSFSVARLEEPWLLNLFPYSIDNLKSETTYILCDNNNKNNKNSVFNQWHTHLKFKVCNLGKNNRKFNSSWRVSYLKAYKFKNPKIKDVVLVFDIGSRYLRIQTTYTCNWSEPSI